MPTYGYECKSCGHSFDAFQSMTDEPLKTCPECGKAVRRLINGGTGVIFKGGGFYVTDRGGKTSGGSTESAKPAAKAASEPAAPSAKAESSAKADTSPKAVNS